MTALTADVGPIDDIPTVSSADDFEIVRAAKVKPPAVSNQFTLLEDLTMEVKDAGITNWDVLYLQFKDPSSGECGVFSIPVLSCITLLDYNNIWFLFPSSFRIVSSRRTSTHHVHPATY